MFEPGVNSNQTVSPIVLQVEVGSPPSTVAPIVFSCECEGSFEITVALAKSSLAGAAKAGVATNRANTPATATGRMYQRFVSQSPSRYPRLASGGDPTVRRWPHSFPLPKEETRSPDGLGRRCRERAIE